MGSRAAPLCGKRAARDHAEARDETHGSFRAKSKEVEMPTGGVRTGRRKDDNTRRFPRPIDGTRHLFENLYKSGGVEGSEKSRGRGRRVTRVGGKKVASRRASRRSQSFSVGPHGSNGAARR